MTEEFITPIELAKRLNVSRTSIHNWAKDGTLPHLRIGAMMRFDWNLISERIRVNYPLKKRPHEDQKDSQ